MNTLKAQIVLLLIYYVNTQTPPASRNTTCDPSTCQDSFPQFTRATQNGGDVGLGQSLSFRSVSDARACYSICLSSQCTAFMFKTSVKDCFVSFTNPVSFVTGNGCGTGDCNAYTRTNVGTGGTGRSGVTTPTPPGRNNSVTIPTAGRDLVNATVPRAPNPPPPSNSSVGRGINPSGGGAVPAIGSTGPSGTVRCKNSYCVGACNSQGLCDRPATLYMCMNGPCWEPCEQGTNFCYLLMAKFTCSNGPCQVPCNGANVCPLDSTFGNPSTGRSGNVTSPTSPPSPATTGNAGRTLTPGAPPPSNVTIIRSPSPGTIANPTTGGTVGAPGTGRASPGTVIGGTPGTVIGGGGTVIGGTPGTVIGGGGTVIGGTPGSTIGGGVGGITIPGVGVIPGVVGKKPCNNYKIKGHKHQQKSGNSVIPAIPGGITIPGLGGNGGGIGVNIPGIGVVTIPGTLQAGQPVQFQPQPQIPVSAPLQQKPALSDPHAGHQHN
jgi:hypothetical protein